MPVSSAARLPRRTSLWMSISCIALLAGCGGGGEDGTSPVSPYLSQFAAPGPVNIAVLNAFFAGANGANVVTDTAALLASSAYLNTPATIAWLRANFDPNITGQVYAMRSSGAAFAHAAGVTGDGELIAISDERMSPGHAVFAGKSVVIDSNSTGGNEHGTSVASVALGNSANFVGTAPDADLLFGTYDTDDDLASLGQEALARGAVAWNNSWGYVDANENTITISQTAFNSTFSGTSGQAYLASLDAYAAQGVVIFAMSNDESEVNAGIMDALPFLRPSLEAGWIAAVNGVPTFTNGNVSSVNLLSSSCLQAARWCMIADGSWNAATGSGSTFAFTTGSSFAAPQISGALALLAEAFPLLDPHDLRVRLLASAEDGFFTPDDTVELATGFFKGYSITYGHGFLDIEAALKPIGGTTMTLSEGGTISTNEPVLLTGTAFGDAIEMSLNDTDVMVKDALSAGFVMPAEALTAGAQPGSRAAALLSRSLASNLAVERTTEAAALSDPFAAFGGNTVNLYAPDGLSKASVLVPQAGAGSAGVTFTRALTDGATRIEMGLKVARDDGQMMSLDGNSGATMASVTLGLTQDLGGSAFLALSGEMGITDLGGSTALSNASSARFDSVEMKIGRSDVFAKGDRLTLGVGMPVAVASGTTQVDLPVYREGAAMAFEPVNINLAPEDRQMDMTVSYQTALADGLEMKLSLAHSDNFGNRAGVTDTGGALAFTFRF